jgi:hypothetical protein
MLVKGEIVEAFEKAYTKEGIGRYHIADGWISEKLRGGNEDVVVIVLRELLASPAKYRVTRSGGAKVRDGPLLTSDDKGKNH